MSDTPRTDEAWMYDSDNLKTVDVDFAMQLERELNAANQHIKRLEEQLSECNAHRERLIESSMAAWARIDDQEDSR